MDQVSPIIAYECEELSAIDCIKLFADLIKSGLCWELQGHYGRTAKSLIKQQIINNKGNINPDLDSILEDRQ